jgi:ribosomal protein S18 acetylase RimI-like enzyme
LYIARWPEEIRIVDLALLPEYRNAGIGTGILTDLIAEATQSNKPVRIHVERFNPALNLYRRLGFAKIGEHGVYDLMERHCSTPA